MEGLNLKRCQRVLIKITMSYQVFKQTSPVFSHTSFIPHMTWLPYYLSASTWKKKELKIEIFFLYLSHLSFFRRADDKVRKYSLVVCGSIAVLESCQVSARHFQRDGERKCSWKGTLSAREIVVVFVTPLCNRLVSVQACLGVVRGFKSKLLGGAGYSPWGVSKDLPHQFAIFSIFTPGRK